MTMMGPNRAAGPSPLRGCDECHSCGGDMGDMDDVPHVMSAGYAVLPTSGGPSKDEQNKRTALQNSSNGL